VKKFISFYMAETSTVIEFKRETPLTGVISYLNGKCEGDACDRKLVFACASGVHGRDLFPARNVADLRTDSYWMSNKGLNTWIYYDFYKMRFRPTHYSVRSYASVGPGGHHIRSWVLEWSNDAFTWTEVDRRENQEELNDKSVIRSFDVRACQLARFVRLRMIGRNWADDFVMTLSAFELFGELKEG
jgi:hypothetical protein